MDGWMDGLHGDESCARETVQRGESPNTGGTASTNGG